jgi:hypothetical protein
VTAQHLAATDPIPPIIDWLSGHSAVTAALGGAGRVGLDNRPPYPRLRVVEGTGGDERDLTWLIVCEVQIEVYGDLDGSPGKEALRQALYTALGALAELPGQPVTQGPVITSVRSSRAGGWVPEPNGQPRYLAAVRVHVHPLQG